jgi:hypothetical protein
MSVTFRKGRFSLVNESPELKVCGTAVRTSDPVSGGRTVGEDQVGYFTCDLQESDGRLGQTMSPDSFFMPVEASPGLALPLRRREPPIRRGAAKTQFVLTGFSHQAGLRVFGFEAVAADQSRTKFSVSADIALSRSHGIRVQELPLLCIRFLEQHQTGDEKRDLTLAEEDMCVYANNCASEREAAQRKRSPRRPPGNVAARTEWQWPQRRP